jgi:hypothetical protein
MSNPGAEPDLAEAIARRVVELLCTAESAPQSGRLVDAAILARELASSAIGSTPMPPSWERSGWADRRDGFASTGARSASGSPPSAAQHSACLNGPGAAIWKSCDTRDAWSKIVGNCKSGRAARQRPRPDTGR